MDDCKAVVPSPKRSTLWVSTIILRIIMSFLKSYQNKIRGTLIFKKLCHVAFLGKGGDDINQANNSSVL